jgi:hypothetical protein
VVGVAEEEVAEEVAEAEAVVVVEVEVEVAEEEELGEEAGVAAESQEADRRQVAAEDVPKRAEEEAEAVAPAVQLPAGLVSQARPTPGSGFRWPHFRAEDSTGARVSSSVPARPSGGLPARRS